MLTTVNISVIFLTIPDRIQGPKTERPKRKKTGDCEISMSCGKLMLGTVKWANVV